MDTLYHEMLLDLYKHPLNKKMLKNFDIRHQEHNPVCGDVVELFIKTNKQGAITDIGWQGDGCAISQSGASLLTDEVKGKTTKKAKAMTSDAMLTLLGLEKLNPTRLRCATLALEALKKAL
jgi:nitrogen fixation NifU-like protein